MPKRLVAVLLVLVAVAAVGLYFVFRPQPLAIGLQPGSVNYPMMYAVTGGFFEREGLEPEVRVFGSANDALDSLLGGSILIDSVIPLQNLAEIEEQQPGSLGILAVLISDSDHPLDYLVVPAESSIVRTADLAGKRLVVFPGTYSETLTRLTLESLGIEGVQFIKRAPAEMAQALQTGEADAGILYDPVATQAEQLGWGRILEPAFWERHLLPEIVVGGYTFNVAAAQAEPRVAEKAFAAIRKAIIAARENPDAAKRAMIEYLPAFAEVIDQLPDARVELADEVDSELIRATLELYEEHGIAPAAVDLEPALARAGGF